MNLIGKVNVVGPRAAVRVQAVHRQWLVDRRGAVEPDRPRYSAVQIAYQLVKGTAKAEPGATISIGRVGSITLDDTNSADMAPPFEFNKGNIEEFSKIY